MEGTEKEEQKTANTLMILCPVCGSDVGETLGVTGRMDEVLAASVVMCCDECRTVYLSPPPVVEDQQYTSDQTMGRIFHPLVQRLQQDIPPDTKFLCAEPSETSLLDRNPKSGLFDLILLPLCLESSIDPNTLLSHVGELLSLGGKVNVVTSNTDSSTFRVFGGRHWFGYRFPLTRQHFGLRGIERLSQNAGLRVRENRTTFSPNSWLLSMRNWLVDWGARRSVVTILTGRWLLPWLIASLFESVAALRGKASVLLTVLEKE